MPASCASRCCANIAHIAPPPSQARFDPVCKSPSSAVQQAFAVCKSFRKAVLWRRCGGCAGRDSRGYQFLNAQCLILLPPSSSPSCRREERSDPARCRASRGDTKTSARCKTVVEIWEVRRAVAQAGGYRSNGSPSLPSAAEPANVEIRPRAQGAMRAPSAGALVYVAGTGRTNARRGTRQQQQENARRSVGLEVSAKPARQDIGTAGASANAGASKFFSPMKVGNQRVEVVGIGTELQTPPSCCG